MDLIQIGVITLVVLVALVALGLILSRLYHRASKEVSFVRTGFRGQTVIINGGAMVLPVLHEIIPVNMNTLRLEVKRSNEQALITRDRMRVDVTAEFYVRAKPTEEAIAAAAQTLGLKTMHPEQLKQLVEGKFVDALRAVAAEMAMEELHEKRVDFVQKVQQVVSEDLLKNGLELESVSLTGLDQTGFEHFNPQNAF
ncbi:MAG: flotillin family protein, partial [Pseudomonadota bacterium]